MRAAAVAFDALAKNAPIYDWMHEQLERAKEANASLIVFPALVGNLFKSEADFIEKTFSLSERFPDICICPGSFFETAGGRTYHTSFVVHGGKRLWKQRQLYLAKWERKRQLSRGNELVVFEMHGVKTAIILNTDVFYPQVARFAAMQGVTIVLSPLSLIKPASFAKQLSGLWQNVRQNLFFAIESAFNGSFMDASFHGKTIIHAPLELNERQNGIVKMTDDGLIMHDLPLGKLDRAKRLYNPIRQLNIPAYRKLF